MTKDTPPCFIWHTYEDNAVPVENSLQFAEALRKAGVPFDLHIYQKGPHGLGLGTREWNPEKRHPWTRDCIFWLRCRGLRSRRQTELIGVAELIGVMRPRFGLSELQHFSTPSFRFLRSPFHSGRHFVIARPRGFGLAVRQQTKGFLWLKL